jgi:hypothetical protein
VQPEYKRKKSQDERIIGLAKRREKNPRMEKYGKQHVQQETSG